MSGFALQTLFEVILVLAVIWGIFHEDKIILWEKRLFAAIRRRRLKVIKTEKVSSLRVLETGR